MVPVGATNRDQCSQYIRKHLAFFRFISASVPPPRRRRQAARARPVDAVAALCCLVDAQPPLPRARRAPLPRPCRRRPSCPDHADGPPRPRRAPLPRPRRRRPSCPDHAAVASASPCPDHAAIASAPAPTTPPSPLPRRAPCLCPYPEHAAPLILWSGPALPPSSLFFLHICMMFFPDYMYMYVCISVYMSFFRSFFAFL